MFLFAAESAASGGSAVVIAITTSGGLLLAILGWVKLRGDNDSAAVSQAQGAMETMEQLNEALERALDRANKRTDFYRGKYREVVAERNELVARWGPFPDAEVVVDVVDDPETS